MNNIFRTRDIITNIINIVMAIIETLLLFRLVLKLFSANEVASFVRWVYETSNPLLKPFEGMFPTAVESGSIFEMSTLFAIMVYAVVGYLLISIVDAIYRASK